MGIYYHNGERHEVYKLMYNGEYKDGVITGGDEVKRVYQSAGVIWDFNEEAFIAPMNTFYQMSYGDVKIAAPNKFAIQAATSIYANCRNEIIWYAWNAETGQSEIRSGKYPTPSNVTSNTRPSKPVLSYRNDSMFGENSMDYAIITAGTDINNMYFADTFNAYSVRESDLDNIPFVYYGYNQSTPSVRKLERSELQHMFKYVTNMKDAFYYASNLKGEPIAPENVVNMYRAYINCTNVTGNLILPNKVENAMSTYLNCKNATGMAVIGKNVTNAKQAFWGAGVTEAHIHHAGGDMSSCFVSCHNLETVKGDWTNRYEIVPFINYGGITNMNNCFYNCLNLKEVNMLLPQNTVTPLKDMAFCFYNCVNLTDVPIIPSTVQNLSNCFRNCTSLKRVELWNGQMNSSTDGLVDYWGTSDTSKINNMDYAFYNCVNLEEAPDIPPLVSSLQYTFINCNKMGGTWNFPVVSQSVTMPNLNSRSSSSPALYVNAPGGSWKTAWENSAYFKYSMNKSYNSARNIYLN